MFFGIISLKTWSFLTKPKPSGSYLVARRLKCKKQLLFILRFDLNVMKINLASAKTIEKNIFFFVSI
jgi:hypothetical protein